MNHFHSEPGTPSSVRTSSQQATDSVAAWTAFATAENVSDLCRAWLELQGGQITEASMGLILLKSPEDGAYIPAAIWPDSVADVTALAEAARMALTERRGIEIRADSASGAPEIHVALPVETDTTLQGVIVIALASPIGEARLVEIRRYLYWGSAWLVNLFLKNELRHWGDRVEQAALVLDLTLLALEKRDFEEALLALTNALAVKLGLRRASIGLEENGSLRIKAISHTAHFKRQSESVQLIERCMEEAFDQQHDMHYPSVSGAASDGRCLVVTVDHERLAAAETSGGAASFLLTEHGRPFGVLTLEYPEDRPATIDALELGAAVARLLAPALATKRELNYWFTGKLKARLQHGLEKLFGPSHAGYKVTAMSLVLLVGFLVLAEGEFRVKAKTSIEGLVQRAAVAPFEGYIGQAPVRAGDRVEAGQVLATLDDKDLQLEKIRLDSEREQTLRKYRDALAKHDRASASVLGAQLNQTEAQLDLVREKLARSQIRAPFDGVVVSGDLSQMLGAPVEQGKVLFEIAPLDAYRVILKVDERDIAYVEVGQRGRLALSGLTDEPQLFSVKKVTPVATAEEGINYFRVEAELDEGNPYLRPGMEGIGKIRVGERHLWWIWTRRLFDWLRISLWTWLP